MKISVQELLSLNSIIVIDIRDLESYQKGHIPGAKHIISSELLYHPSLYLQRNVKYCLYCDVGYISEDVCRRLRVQGYQTFSLLGGYRNYLLCR